ncbi:MAG: aminotransferase class V-fold PLP-dependent enzyme, partial [Arcobacteraceae bacterium]|nr:aminotransferase class V-fold PLP-dependent enzyme [Arcobacteraceae bacterium]
MFKNDFPYFNNSKVVYLDNAATTQKPQAVIDAQVKYYTHYCANTHRSSFSDANKATQQYENARATLKNFINASKNEEVIFTKGVTESINFVASSFAKKFDTIIISSLEHHSNIVPWHMQGRVLNKGLEVVKCTPNLEFDFEDFERLLQQHKNAFVSITHISNAFGTIHNIKAIIQLAH